MKREFLEGLEVNGVKLTKEIIDSIMDANGKDIEAGKNALSAKEAELASVTTERDGLKSQIADRNKDIKALQEKVGNNEELTKQLTELQTKYDTDTTALQQKIADQSIGYATEKFFADVKFTSDLAKKAAIADFKEQKFKYDDKTGEFIGGKDWVENLKKSNTAAFESDPAAKPNEPTEPKHPYFSGPTTRQDGSGNNSNAPVFHFGFAGVRPHEAQETSNK